MKKFEIIYTTNYMLVVADEEIKENLKKVIAHLPLNNAPLLEGVMLLPEVVVGDDVEKLACKYGNINYPMPYGYVGSANDFFNGYKAATKIYSEDDLRQAIGMAREGKIKQGYQNKLFILCVVKV